MVAPAWSRPHGRGDVWPLAPAHVRAAFVYGVRMRLLPLMLVASIACAAEDDDDPIASTTDADSSGGASSASGATTQPSTSTTAGTATTTPSTTAADSTTDDTATTPGSTTDDGSTGEPGLGCANLDLLVCEDFEGEPLDGYPAGWGKRETGTWLGNTMGVSADDAYRGAQSLRIAGGENGAQWLSYNGGLGGLATEHWGRMFVRVQTPAPVPQGGVLHGDLFEARGPYGEGNTNSVRWGTVENTEGFFQWIYNVQRSTDEFATGTDYTYQWMDAWFCMEWHHDQVAQEATLWLDGVEVTAITQSAATNPEIPVFDDISVGWANYQSAMPEFVVFIDEVALDDARIGCDGV